MNLRKGGTGGFDWINRNRLNNESGFTRAAKGGKLAQQRAKSDKVRAGAIRKNLTLGNSVNRNSVKRDAVRLQNALRWKGQRHTVESRQRLSQTHMGSLNSSFGTCWITKDGVNRKVKRDTVPAWQVLGWSPGRVLTKS
jgi:hypothetical protein